MTHEEQINAIQKPFYSIDEAAQIAGVHPNTIRNRIKDGTLKAGRAGWQWRIAKEALLDFLKACN